MVSLPFSSDFPAAPGVRKQFCSAVSAAVLLSVLIRPEIEKCTTCMLDTADPKLCLTIAGVKLSFHVMQCLLASGWAHKMAA